MRSSGMTAAGLPVERPLRKGVDLEEGKGRHRASLRQIARAAWSRGRSGPRGRGGSGSRSRESAPAALPRPGPAGRGLPARSNRPAPRHGIGRNDACRWCACAGHGARQARDIRRRRRGSAARSSSGHSRSINWSIAWLDARQAPHSSQAAISSPNTASAPASPSILVEHQRDDHRAVEHQVRLVMEVVGARSRPSRCAR